MVVAEKLGKFAKNLRQGQTIYRVYALGKSSHIVSAMVMSRPYKSRLGHWMIDVKGSHVFDGCSFESLGDMNALQGLNHYNNHRTFTSKRRALRYLDRCIKYNIGLLYDDYDMYDVYDDDHSDWWDDRDWDEVESS